MTTTVKGRDLRIGNVLKIATGEIEIVSISPSEALISTPDACKTAKAINVTLSNGTTVPVHPAQNYELA